MGRGRITLFWVGVGAILLAGCGPTRDGGESSFPSSDPNFISEGHPPVSQPSAGLEVDPAQPEHDPGQPRPVASLFQPGFHLALRWSQNVEGLTTFRLRVPVN